MKRKARNAKYTINIIDACLLWKHKDITPSMPIISTDWCKNVLSYHLTRDINTRIQLKVTLMIQTQMTFQARGNALWHRQDVCAHTSCSPDLLSVSRLLHIHQSLTTAPSSRPVSAGMCQCAQSVQASGQADSDRSSCLDSLSSNGTWTKPHKPKRRGAGRQRHWQGHHIWGKNRVCLQHAHPGIYYSLLAPVAFHLLCKNMCLTYIIKSEGYKLRLL